MRRMPPTGLRPQAGTLLLAISLGISGGVACVGTIYGGDDSASGVGGSGGSGVAGAGGVAASNSAASVPGSVLSPSDALIPVRVRLLNPNEYNNTVAALLGDTTSPGNTFPTPNSQNGYLNNAGQTIDDLLASSLQTAAQSLATNALAHLSDFLPCDPTTVAPQTCAGQFIATFGKKAYRRPVTADETTTLMTVYNVGATGGSFSEGIGLVIQTMLQSPNFLYTTELGSSPTPATSIASLDPYELASAISYLVLASPPDDTLMAAADAGDLSDPSKIEAQVRRLLTDPRAKSQLQQFVSQWLGIGNVSVTTKDPTLYPKFTSTLQQMMLAETNAFAQDVIFNGDASFNSLMTANYSFVDKELGALYGVTAAQNGQLQRVTMPAGQRSGLLTQASVMTIYSHPNETSPILRGVFLRERVLCETLPPPPNGTKIVIPQPNPNAPNTTRAIFDAHVSDPACSGCHSLIDPVGNLFEEYDAIGAYRTKENGYPIDSTGTVTGTIATNGAFSNAPQFAKALGASTEGQTCFSRNIFRFASAQSDPDTESNMLGILAKNPQTSALEIIVAYAKSNLFAQRAAAQ
jgi:hypothetical protein